MRSTPCPSIHLVLRCITFSYIPESAFTRENEGYSSPYYLHWYKPSCGHCEAEGKYCGRKINSTGDETECFIHEYFSSLFLPDGLFCGWTTEYSIE